VGLTAEELEEHYFSRDPELREALSVLSHDLRN
jgi:hypothetical protein